MLKFGSVRSNQSQSSTPGLPTNGSLVLKYILSESIHNRSSGTHFDKFLISNFLKGLTYSGSVIVTLVIVVVVVVIIKMSNISVKVHFPAISSFNFTPPITLFYFTFTPLDTPIFSINSSSGASDLSYLDFDRFVL